MKSKAHCPLPARLSCAILSFCLAVGGLFCLITSFHLPVRPAMLLIPAALCCAVVAVLSRFRWSSVVFLAAWGLGLGAVLLWDRASLEEGLRCAYTAITTVYSNAYSFAFPVWKPGVDAECSVLFLLWILGAVYLIFWAIYHQSAVLAIGFSVLPLAMCLVVVDTPPELWCLLLLLSAILLLVLTQSCRRRSASGASVLALVLLVPVAALVCGLCAAMPPDTYQRGQVADQLMKSIVSWLTDVTALRFDADGGIILDGLSSNGPSPRTLSLEVGPRQNSNRKVMEVLVSEADVMYLRGCTYGNYTGTAWRQLADSSYEGLEEPELSLTVPNATTTRTVSIRTTSVHDVIYTPYYLFELPDVGRPFQDAYLFNEDRLREYTVPYNALFKRENIVDRVIPSPESEVLAFGSLVALVPVNEYGAFAEDYYTRLPEETRQNMLALAEEAGILDAPVDQLAASVASYVRSSATYDINTPKMPEGADFATWFLTESDTGYCLHFATAAATMLRALGVPARLVSGYLVDAPTEEWTEVTSYNAHAWVEYYAGAEWMALEATPSVGVETTLGHSVAHSTGQSANPQNPTVPTQPTESKITPTEEASSPSVGGPVSRPSDRSQWQPPAWLVWLLAAVALFLLRRPVTLALRQRKLSRGDTNRQLLAHWAYGCRLARHLGDLPVSEELPLKARFSQHAITRAELKQVTTWEAELKQKLLKAPLWKRLYYQWILILA